MGMGACWAGCASAFSASQNAPRLPADGTCRWMSGGKDPKGQFQWSAEMPYETAIKQIKRIAEHNPDRPIKLLIPSGMPAEHYIQFQSCDAAIKDLEQKQQMQDTPELVRLRSRFQNLCSKCEKPACEHGRHCTNHAPEHLENFAHPGDWDYRIDRVSFPAGNQPEFDTIRTLFNYFDPDESGSLSHSEFESLLITARKTFGMKDITLEDAWEKAGGGTEGRVNFTAFAAWLQPLGVSLPVGVETEQSSFSCHSGRLSSNGVLISETMTVAEAKQKAGALKGCAGFYYQGKPDVIGAVEVYFLDNWSLKTLTVLTYTAYKVEDTIERPCRFCVKGERCFCRNFKRDESNSSGLLCVCGHKQSMHRSDGAERPPAEFLTEMVTNHHWSQGATGLVEVTDPNLLCTLQGYLTSTHKGGDNWTRDRGCTLHGVNGDGCAFKCASKHRMPVPNSFKLVRAFRNQNPVLWSKYSLLKTAIAEECQAKTIEGDVAYERTTVESQHDLDSRLDTTCNEWRLLHGTSLKACRGICASNFRLALAGSGATWKDGAKKASGTPLYGFGVYTAEKITKADEYSKPIPEGEPDAGMFTVLVCRVIGGKANVVVTNEIDTTKLREQVWDGPYHSVLGDRRVKLGKPYREVVVYDKDQVYPEFMLVYQREYLRRSLPLGSSEGET